MKIYAIYADNNQTWEDAWYGILEEHIYLDPKIAKEVCFKLNNPIINEPTTQEWEECGWDCSWEEFVEDYRRSQYNTHTHEVKELEAK